VCAFVQSLQNLERQKKKKEGRKDRDCICNKFRFSSHGCNHDWLQWVISNLVFILEVESSLLLFMVLGRGFPLLLPAGGCNS